MLSELDPERAARPCAGSGPTCNKLTEELVASSSYPELPIWGTFDSMEVMVEAARAGLGLVMLPTYVGDPDPDLSASHKPDVRHVADFWLLSHRDLRDNARLRAAREAITAALTERAALFRGEADGVARNCAAASRTCTRHGVAARS